MSGKARSNSRVLARIRCPRCQRPNVSVMQNYRTYEHLNADGSGMPCLGSPAEFVFTEMLREAELDVRPDNMQVTFEVDIEPELAQKQQRREAETRAMFTYQRREVDR